MEGRRGGGCEGAFAWNSDEGGSEGGREGVDDEEEEEEKGVFADGFG